ncbi:uncharacterized protein TrAtP1_001239 [Trichoderma atroviride]|uniref:uncharacterized protein n=1 Tax=Hypocrea atroviridis TaxID=63577 RepID=UPI0033259E49|nr:hypothetical protein TrAtP1_001239 [Trichoderma atroviride]
MAPTLMITTVSKNYAKRGKMDLVEAKEGFEYKKKCCLDEDVVVKKIQGAIKAVRNAESREDASAPFNSVANTQFHMYCVDHVKHCFWENNDTKRVEFLY